VGRWAGRAGPVRIPFQLGSYRSVRILATVIRVAGVFLWDYSPLLIILKALPTKFPVVSELQSTLSLLEALDESC
jgi:hypothetical protein